MRPQPAPLRERHVPRRAPSPLDGLAGRLWPGARVVEVVHGGSVLAVESDGCDVVCVDTAMSREATAAFVEGGLRALVRSGVEVGRRAGRVRVKPAASVARMARARR